MLHSLIPRYSEASRVRSNRRLAWRQSEESSAIVLLTMGSMLDRMSISKNEGR